MKFQLLGAAAIALALAGCGTNEKDRVGGGAATGAATGAVIGAVGGPVGVGAGALIGAGVGAGTGAATTPNQVNLGTPPWSNPQTRVAGEPLSEGRSVRHAATRHRHVTRAAAHHRAQPTGTPASTNGTAAPNPPPAAPPAPGTTGTAPSGGTAPSR